MQLKLEQPLVAAPQSITSLRFPVSDSDWWGNEIDHDKERKQARGNGEAGIGKATSVMKLGARPKIIT